MQKIPYRLAVISCFDTGFFSFYRSFLFFKPPIWALYPFCTFTICIPEQFCYCPGNAAKFLSPGKHQQKARVFPLLGNRLDSQAHFIAHPFAQIQSNPCRTLPIPPVVSSKPFFKNTGKVAFRDANPIVLHAQLHLIAKDTRLYRNPGTFFSPVFYRIDQQLAENEFHPFAVR